MPNNTDEEIFTATVKLRYLKTIVVLGTGQTVEHLELQQLWGGQYGTQEWRPVPTVDAAAG